MSCATVQVLPHFTCAEEKNRLLRAVAGSGLDSLSSLRAKWDKLELVVESHQLMIKEQVGRKSNTQTNTFHQSKVGTQLLYPTRQIDVVEIKYLSKIYVTMKQRKTQNF